MQCIHPPVPTDHTPTEHLSILNQTSCGQDLHFLIRNPDTQLYSIDLLSSAYYSSSIPHLPHSLLSIQVLFMRVVL